MIYFSVWNSLEFSIFFPKTLEPLQQDFLGVSFFQRTLRTRNVEIFQGRGSMQTICRILRKVLLSKNFDFKPDFLKNIRIYKNLISNDFFLGLFRP